MLHIKRFQIILASQVNKFYDNSIETTTITRAANNKTANTII